MFKAIQPRYKNNIAEFREDGVPPYQTVRDGDSRRRIPNSFRTSRVQLVAILLATKGRKTPSHVLEIA